MIDVDQAVGTIVIALDDIHELFVAPVQDPMSNRFQNASGVDQIVKTASPRQIARVKSIDIDLPSGAGLAPDPLQVQTAQHGYCDQRLDDLAERRRAILRRGFKELVFGVAFLALCLGLAAAVAAGITSPDWVRQFTSEGLIIVGWIALWHPVDMLLFEQWPVAREMRIIKGLSRLKVSFLVT